MAGELKNLFVSLGVVLEDFDQKIKQAKGSINGFVEEVAAQSKKVNQTTINIGSMAEQIGMGFREGSKGTVALNEALKNTGVSVEQMATKFQVAGAAVAAFVTGSTYLLSQFETNMRNVMTLIDPSLAEERVGAFYKAYQKGIRELALEYGKSTQELSTGLYNILSASIEAGKAMQVLEVATKAATAGVSDVGTATQVISSILNSYSMSADEAARVSDILFTLVRKGVVTFQEVGTSIGQVTSIAASFGIPLEEVAAILAYATRNGIEFRRAVTQLRAIMTALIAPTDQARKTMEGLGININESTIKSEGLIKNIAKLQGLSQEQIVRITQVREALPLVTAILGDVTSVLGDYSIMLNSSNASEEAFAKQACSLSMDLNRLKEASKDLMMSFAEPFTGVIRKASDAATGMADAFSRLPEGLKNTISYLTLAGGAVSLFLGGVLKLLPSIGKMKGELIALGGVMGLIKSGMATLASFFTGLPGIISTATLALGAFYTKATQDMSKTTDEVRKLILAFSDLDDLSLEEIYEQLAKIKLGVEDMHNTWVSRWSDILAHTQNVTLQLVAIILKLVEMKEERKLLNDFGQYWGEILQRIQKETENVTLGIADAEDRQRLLDILNIYQTNAEIVEELSGEIDKLRTSIQAFEEEPPDFLGLKNEKLYTQYLNKLKEDYSTTQQALNDVLEKQANLRTKIETIAGKDVTEVLEDLHKEMEDKKTKTTQDGVQDRADAEIEGYQKVLSVKEAMEKDTYIKVLEMAYQAGATSGKEFIQRLEAYMQDTEDMSDDIKSYIETRVKDIEGSITSITESELQAIKSAYLSGEMDAKTYLDNLENLLDEVSGYISKSLTVDLKLEIEKAEEAIEEKTKAISESVRTQFEDIQSSWKAGGIGVDEYISSLDNLLNKNKDVDKSVREDISNALNEAKERSQELTEAIEKSLASFDDLHNFQLITTQDYIKLLNEYKNAHQMTAQGSEALANKEKELYQTMYSEALRGLESVRDRIIELQKEWTAIEIEESIRRGNAQAQYAQSMFNTLSRVIKTSSLRTQEEVYQVQTQTATGVVEAIQEVYNSLIAEHENAGETMISSDKTIAGAIYNVYQDLNGKLRDIYKRREDIVREYTQKEADAQDTLRDKLIIYLDKYYDFRKIISLTTDELVNMYKSIQGISLPERPETKAEEVYRERYYQEQEIKSQIQAIEDIREERDKELASLKEEEREVETVKNDFNRSLVELTQILKEQIQKADELYREEAQAVKSILTPIYESLQEATRGIKKVNTPEALEALKQSILAEIKSLASGASELSVEARQALQSIFPTLEIEKLPQDFSSLIQNISSGLSDFGWQVVDWDDNWLAINEKIGQEIDQRIAGMNEAITKWGKVIEDFQGKAIKEIALPTITLPDTSKIVVEVPERLGRIKDTLSEISLPIQSLGQDFNNLNLQVLELTDSVNDLARALISIPSNIKTRVNIEGDTAEEWLGKALGLGSMMGMGANNR